MTIQFYTSIGNKEVKSFFLALTIRDQIKPVQVDSYFLAWTLEAYQKFELIKTSISDQNKNLPYASLRGLLQIYFDNIEYLDKEIQLKDINKNKEEYIKSFAYLGETNEALINKNFCITFNEWTTNYLRPYVQKNKSNLTIIDELQELLEQNKLITIKQGNYKILPWPWNVETGTTNGKAYKGLVEFIARQIAGKEIFENCGTMKRIISSDSGSGQAELMTDPISINGKKGKFSLVIKLEIVTFPSIHQPVLKIDVSIRRWVYNLTNARHDLGNINGYVFNENYPDKAFQYKVISKYNDDKKNTWYIDQDFEPLRRKFKILSSIKTGQDIVNQADNVETKVVLTFRNGLQDSYDIQVGVPEIDKLTAYQSIYKILKPIGFIPFENYREIKATHPDSKIQEINIVTLLGAILQYLDNDNVSNLIPEYFSNLTTEEKNSLLKKYFNLSLSDFFTQKKGIEYDKGKKLPDLTTELQLLIKSNKEALEKLYPNEDLQLIIFYQDDLATDLKFVENIAKITLGNKVKVVTNRLPQNVHGDRYSLPYSNEKAQERSKARIKEWEHITQQLAKQNKRTFCLILAKKWYGNKPDDHINKPSTRQVLASSAGSAVQFLLPIERTKKGLIKLDDYFHRVQSALKDLFSAHSGRIDNIQEKVNTYLKKITPEKRPKEIIGITIVRKQKGRFRKELDPTYLLIATRLNVETGICELCYACEQNNKLHISQWYHFVDGIKEVAKISPVKLVSKESKKKNKLIDQIRFIEFLNQVISESVNKGNNPIILIDSSNCVRLCPWLKDVEITTHNIKLSSHYEYMENNWNGARIIRIRQDLAPGFTVEKVRQYAQSSLEDTRIKEELTCDYEIPSATSKTKGLFKLKTNSQTGCITYLSIGKKTLQTKQRGQSCYKETEYHQVIKGKKNKANLELCEMIKKPIFIDHYPTPNPLEIVVTLRQKDDNPDDLAIFVESLRYGFGHYKDWSTLPAPLFFERVIRDYISEFSITDEEDFTSETEDKTKQLSLFD